MRGFDKKSDHQRIPAKRTTKSRFVLIYFVSVCKKKTSFKMMKSRLLGGVIMEGKQQQIIKEESHSPSSPRTTTPTPPTPQQIVPSGKENRIGSRDNGISGSRALTTSPALNTSTTTTVTAPNSGTASGHQQHGNLTNSEILTRSRSKGESIICEILNNSTF